MRVLQSFAVALVLSLGCCISAFAQNRQVSGKVLDINQQPVIGAAVMLSGSASQGAVTDVDGNFTLNVPASDVTLDVSCLGYSSQLAKLQWWSISKKTICFLMRLSLWDTVPRRRSI